MASSHDASEGQLRVRIFGSNVVDAAFRGFDELKTKTAASMLFDVDVASSALFLDAVTTFPTVAGLGVTLQVNGTYSASYRCVAMFSEPEIICQTVLLWQILLESES
jgi:hypothetical protein